MKACSLLLGLGALLLGVAVEVMPLHASQSRLFPPLGRSTRARIVPIRSANPGVLNLVNPNQFSRLFVLSDVHGMFQPLTRLLTQAKIINPSGHWNAGNSMLMIIGDSIDKGPDSVDVISLWLRISQEAQAQGGFVLHLLGNHEAAFLARVKPAEAGFTFEQELGEKGISPDQYLNPANLGGRYFRSMPVAAQIGNWIFCHSGMIPDMSIQNLAQQSSALLNTNRYADPFFLASDSILEAKGWWSMNSPSRADLMRRLDQNQLRGLVFGHQPVAFNVPGAAAMSLDQRLIKVDNGMAPEAGAHAGSIVYFANYGDLFRNQAVNVMALVGGTARALPRELPSP